MLALAHLQFPFKCFLVIDCSATVLQQCITLTSAKHSAVHQGPSSIPMDRIYFAAFPEPLSNYIHSSDKYLCVLSNV